MCERQSRKLSPGRSGRVPCFPSSGREVPLKESGSRREGPAARPGEEGEEGGGFQEVVRLT